MSVVSTAPAVQDLDALRAVYRSRVGENALQTSPSESAVETTPRSLGDTLHDAVDTVDRAIASHPKTAVTAAAATGWFVGLGKTPVRWLKDHFNTLMATAAGGTLGAFALHVYSAHLPEAMTHLASTLGVSAHSVEEVATLGLVALGAHMGRSMAHRSIDKRDHPEPATGPQESLLKRLGKSALAYSGIAVGGGIGIGLAAFLGATAALPLAAAAAGGVLVGTVLGPFASERGISKSWKWAAVASLVPAAAWAGFHGAAGLQGPIGAGICGIDAAGATLLFPMVRKGLLYALFGIKR